MPSPEPIGEFKTEVLGNSRKITTPEGEELYNYADDPDSGTFTKKQARDMGISHSFIKKNED